MLRLVGIIMTFAVVSLPYAHGGGELANYEAISEFLIRNPRASIESLLEALSPKIRERFQLVYKSRSPNGASLKFPRIILTNEDASFMLGVSGDSHSKRGNVVEIIEADPKTNALQFREISFGSDGIRNEPHPKSCMQCHGSPDSPYQRSAMRPIWDGYPEWPGVFGSAHNEARLYGIGKYGNSGVPTLEFEDRALAELKSRAVKGLDRFRSLIGIENTTTAKLSHVSTMFTEALIRRNMLGLAAVYEESVYEHYLRDPAGYPTFRKNLIRIIEGGHVPADSLPGFRENLEKSMVAALVKERDMKRERFQKLIEEFGTDSDRKILTGPYMGKVDPTIHVASGYVNDILPLAWVGVDPRTLAITRTLGVTGIGTPYVGNVSMVWSNALKSALADEAKPRLGNASCKIIVSPVDVDTNATSAEWIKALGGL
jgi:hypothetical protein